MMMKCDSGAQRSFCRTFEYDSFGSKQLVFFSLMESVWYDLMNSILWPVFWLMKEEE